MAKITTKKAAPVRKKAVAKKAAPVRKKVVAKKAVAKKAAPVRKKAVAKKVAPVREKAVAKKAVAKKAAPARKKAVAKKAVAKKAAPVRKKAVVKKASPVRKKAVVKKASPVRKKAVVKKASPVRKKAAAKKAAPSKIRKIDLSPSSPVISEDKDWLHRETELPVFLKDVKSEIKKEPISTQGYSKKKSRKPVIIGFATVVALLGISVLSISGTSSSADKYVSQNVAVVVSEDSTKSEEVMEEKTSKPTASPTSSNSASAEKPSTPSSNSFAPRNFTSASEGQEINFIWVAPTNSKTLIGYELSAKKSGTAEWVVISSVTPQQMMVSVELVSMDSTSQYRIASILENGKLAFNKAIINHAGTVD